METDGRTDGRDLESLMKAGPSWVRQKYMFVICTFSATPSYVSSGWIEAGTFCSPRLRSGMWRLQPLSLQEPKIPISPSIVVTRSPSVVVTRVLRTGSPSSGSGMESQPGGHPELQEKPFHCIARWKENNLMFLTI